MEHRQTLTKEVEPPQRSSNEIGVMLVASAAMFFAIASSAFILRARAIQSHCANHQPSTVVIEPVQAPLAPTDAPKCGEPVTEINPDGTRTVTYTSCSPNPVIIVDGDETSFATPLPADLFIAR